MKNFEVAVLLPTRNRTDVLKRSVMSLINRAVNPSSIQVIFGFDEDDITASNYFLEEIAPELEKRKINFKALMFEPMGYARLNEYVNEMACQANAHWLFMWNDDALMDTTGWDKEISKYTGDFKVLAVHTHNEHPYSIFPIVPQKWFEICGYISPHQSIDGYVSQLAYLIDRIDRINVYVTHDRYDLTGNNNDKTYQDRVMYEGNPKDPRDFHHISWTQKRYNDADRLAQFIKNNLQQDISWWENVKAGKQDPWEKLKIVDVNKQMRQFSLSSLGIN